MPIEIPVPAVPVAVVPAVEVPPPLPLVAAPLAPATTELPGVAGSSELHADSSNSDVNTRAFVTRSRVLTTGHESEKRIIFIRLSLVGWIDCTKSSDLCDRPVRQTRET